MAGPINAVNRIAARIPADEYERLKAYCEAHSTSVSAVIREALKEYLSKEQRSIKANEQNNLLPASDGVVS